MNTLTATYRVITPMFLGGAEPTAEAELRLPSFKGALRFWWRALMWGEVGDIGELRRREAELFGSSETGQSRILLRTDGAHRSSTHMDGQWGRNSWEQYTGYGLREKDKGERCFIQPDHEWRVHVNLTRCSPGQAGEIVTAVKLFGLAGGLGDRSRKGWGSVTLTELDGGDWSCPTKDGSWISTVKSLLSKNRSQSAPYTAFTRSSKWNVGPIQTTAKAAQQWMGKRYQGWVKDTAPKDHRSQFGLPREYKGGTAPRPERRASPLILHVHWCPNDKALPCALWLPAAFLQDIPQIPGDGQRARCFVEDLNLDQPVPPPAR